MNRICIFLLCLVLLGLYSTPILAQNADYPPSPAPAKATDSIVIIYGGTAHIGNGSVINNSLITLKQGKIEGIADMTNIRLDLQGKKAIDATGKHIYPAIVAANTTMGLVEVAAVRATRDQYEVGDLNPNVRSIIAYNTDSHVLPTIRSNGILLAEVAPLGGTISGQSSVVQLDAWNWEDAAYATDIGLHLYWPRFVAAPNYEDEDEEAPTEKSNKYLEGIKELNGLFAEAKAYCQDKHAQTNLKLEAMCGLFDKSKKVFIHAEFIKEIIDGVNFAKQWGLNPVIIGGTDIWLATDILKENKIPVVINRTHNLPKRSFEDVDLPYKLPKILQDAGILYCITMGDGWDSFWDQRNLPFNAGTAVAYGLTKEQALAAITSNPAQILGIHDKTGTLEIGKDANLLISEGDILDMKTSNITNAFIQGRAVDLDNKQKALYRRFMEKYKKTIKQ